MMQTSPPPSYVRHQLQYGPYSPSRLIVARCPQRFFGQYVRKDQAVTSSINAARGNAIHHVLSEITAVLQAGGKVTTTSLNHSVAQAMGLWPAAYEQVDLVRGAADAYLSNPSPYTNSTTSCEKSFAIAFYEEASFVDDVVPGRCYVPVPYTDEAGRPNKEAFFGGRLDQVTVDEITKTVTILDHKSTPSASKNEDHQFQLGCYAWLVSLFYPGYRIRTVLHYVNPALNFYAAPEYWSQEELANFEGYIHGRITAVESFQEFPALPGSACDYCHMKQECPTNLALMEQRARGPIDLNVSSSADLTRIAEQLHTVGALYDELNKALKQGIEAYAPQGGIAIEGVVYKFKASDEAVDWVSTDIRIRDEHLRAVRLQELGDDGLTQEERDLRNSMNDADREKNALKAQLPDLAAVLKHWGIDPGTFKEWQSQKLKNLWRLDKPALLDMLKEYVVKDKSTRWGAYKN